MSPFFFRDLTKPAFINVNDIREHCLHKASLSTDPDSCDLSDPSDQESSPQQAHLFNTLMIRRLSLCNK